MQKDTNMDTVQRLMALADEYRYQYKPCDCRDYMKFKAIPPALQDHLAEAIRQHKIAGENARNVYTMTPKGATK